LDKWDVTNKDGGVIVEKKDWDKYGTPQDRPELQKLGFGKPGMMEDVYLHIGKEGVVRERRNHLGDGVITVKGTHRRKEGDEQCMTRYCRQLKCKSPPVTTTNKLNEGVQSMVFDDKIAFHDALGGSKPDLQPCFVVNSERYRFGFKYSQPGSPPVSVELSFDISTGQRLNTSGKREGNEIKFCGLEFGLDHLAGTTGGTSGVGSGPTKSSSPKSEPITTGETSSKPLTSQTSSKEPPKPVSDRVLDKEDLNHKSIMDSNGPTFPNFQSLVHNMTTYLTDGKPEQVLNLGGEKAKTMQSMMT
jgi:hypothetical protein